MCRCKLRDSFYLRPLYQFQWLRAHPFVHAGVVTLLDMVVLFMLFALAYTACLAVGWGVCSQFARPDAGYALVLLIYPLVGVVLLSLTALALFGIGVGAWAVAGRCAPQSSHTLQDYVTPMQRDHEPSVISLDIADAQ